MALLQITYVSRATERFSKTDLPDLIATCRRNNAATEVTGALYFAGGRFVQVIEGEEEAVMPLYESIQDDPRHTEVETVGIRSITVRRFPEWGMGHLPAELATTAAREAFRVAHTPAAEWRDDALARILDEFERALAQTQTA